MGKALEEFGNGNQLETDAEVGRQAAAVVDGTLRGIGARHAHAQYILRAQRVGSDRRHQRGIDAAAQRHDGFAEAAFAHIIASAQNQRAVSRLRVVGRRFLNRLGVAGIDNHQVLFKRSGLGDQFSARIQGQRRPIKDQAVVAAHLVAQQHRNAVAPSDGRQHLPSQLALRVPERRRRQVDVHRRMLRHDLLHRVDGVETPRPEILVVPRVFADGDAQAHAVKLNHLLRTSRREVALFIEDVVERQQALVLFQQQLSAIQPEPRH